MLNKKIKNLNLNNKKKRSRSDDSSLKDAENKTLSVRTDFKSDFALDSCKKSDMDSEIYEEIKESLISKDYLTKLKSTFPKKSNKGIIKEFKRKLNHIQDYANITKKIEWNYNQMRRNSFDKTPNDIDSKSKLILQIFALPENHFFIKNKFKPKGIKRSFDDFEWTLEIFGQENPRLCLLGRSARSYFTHQGQIKFFENENQFKHMLNLLSEKNRRKSTFSIKYLRESILSSKSIPKKTPNHEPSPSDSGESGDESFDMSEFVISSDLSKKR